MTSDRAARFAAFTAPGAPDVFRSVLSTSDVWKSDPLDVPEIHAHARETFEGVIARTQTKHGSKPKAYDRLILLLGVAGSGKTHLVTALRNDLHERRQGFFAYMQMAQLSVPDYARYVLWNVVASLEKPMRVELSSETAFEVISRGIFAKAIAAKIVADDGDSEEFDPYAVASELRRRGLYNVDTHVLAAFLVLQRHDVIVSEIVSRYLRCEKLTPYDERCLEFLTTRDQPTLMTQQLACVIEQTFGTPLVICLDQLDNFYTDVIQGGKRFQEATVALDALVNEEIGESIVVLVAMLDDQYSVLKSGLLLSQRDRYETGTKPIVLGGNIREYELRAVLERRLAYLYDGADVKVDEGDRIFPFSADTPERLAGSRLRTALRVFNDARTRSMETGLPPEIIGDEHPPDVIPTRELELSELWNIASLAESGMSHDQRTLMDLLAFGVEAIAPELPLGYSTRVHVESDRISLERTSPHGSRRETVSIVNQTPRGGHLGHALEMLALRATALGTQAVAVRSADFPSSPRTRLFAQLGTFVKAGNRRLTFTPSDWRTLAAYRAFRAEHEATPHFDAWVREGKPLTAIPGMQGLLDLDEAIALAPGANGSESVSPAVSAASLAARYSITPSVPSTSPVAIDQPRLAASPAAPASVSPSASASTKSAVDSSVTFTNRNGTTSELVLHDAPSQTGSTETIVLGTGNDDRRAEIALGTLTRHTAILGGSGSGKTTLAFLVLENLLARGVPAILIDRKGDLCYLADPDAWRRGVDDATAKRRATLLERLAIDVYTPGANAGRNLALTPLPSGMCDALPDDRDEAARAAAVGIGELLGYGRAKNDRLAVLHCAIATLAALVEAPTLDALVTLINEQDPALLAAIGALKPRLLETVANDLAVLRINAKRLLSADAEPLNVERLFGLGEHAVPGKTRLSIISTKALGDGVDALFWVSRLLVDLGRFASRNPKPTLQAVAFFDEADRYLPATSKPITKEPMENLLKRARSGGLGIMLATQSPGDLDYKSKENITTWLVGRVTEERARGKLEGVLGNAKALASLPTLTTGQFFLKNESSLPFNFRADLPAVIPRQIDEAQILELSRQRRRSR